MSIVTWFKELFGTRWSDKEVVQYIGDSMDHGYDTTPDYIRQLRERRPSLHQHQRLLVDAKIRELEADLKATYERERVLNERKVMAKEEARIQELEKRRRRDHGIDLDLTGDYPVYPTGSSGAEKFSGWGSSPTPVSSSSHSYHGGGHTSSHSHSSHSHSCSSSHSSSDSGSSSSDSGGGGGCD